jgi:hypothetical protein
VGQGCARTRGPLRSHITVRSCTAGRPRAAAFQRSCLLPRATIRLLQSLESCLHTVGQQCGRNTPAASTSRQRVRFEPGGPRPSHPLPSRRRFIVGLQSVWKFATLKRVCGACCAGGCSRYLASSLHLTTWCMSKDLGRRGAWGPRLRWAAHPTGAGPSGRLLPLPLAASRQRGIAQAQDSSCPPGNRDHVTEQQFSRPASSACLVLRLFNKHLPGWRKRGCRSHLRSAKVHRAARLDPLTAVAMKLQFNDLNVSTEGFGGHRSSPFSPTSQLNCKPDRPARAPPPS